MLIHFVHEQNALLLGCYHKEKKNSGTSSSSVSSFFKRVSVSCQCVLKKFTSPARLQNLISEKLLTQIAQLPEEDEILGTSLPHFLPAGLDDLWIIWKLSA